MSDRSSTGSSRPPTAPTERSSHQPMRPRSGPNYAIRRAGVGVAAVAVVLVSIIVIGRAIGRDESRSSAGDVDAEWNTVVALSADSIDVIDPNSGDVLDTYPAVGDLLDDQSLVVGSMLVTMTDFGRIAITDLTDGSVRRGQAGTDETMLRSRDHPDIAVIGPDVGGDLTVIDVLDREILSIGDVAGLDSPLMFANAARVNEGGTHVAVSDGRSFQTIVVDLTEGASIALAGQIVAISDDRVVTAQRAGDSTELEFYDLTGERLGSVDLPTPVATMLNGDGDVVAIGADGTIRIAGSDGVDDAGEVTVPAPDGVDDAEPTIAAPTSGVYTASGTRLVVSDGTDTFVVDDRGEQLLYVAEQSTSPITRSTRCVNIGGGFSGPSTIVDVDRGRIIGELDGLLASLTSIDGCTASMLGSGSVIDDDVRVLVAEAGSGTPIWYDGGLLEVIGQSVSAIAPDGRAVAVTESGRTLLVDLDDGNAIEIGAETDVIHFADR